VRFVSGRDYAHNAVCFIFFYLFLISHDIIRLRFHWQPLESLDAISTYACFV